MKKRFSSEELYAVRNFIPIDFVIRNVVKLRWKLDSKIFRFVCPVCGGFDTAINRHTNLARCFQCERNFNTIDIVMLVRGSSFVESVLSLKSCHNDFLGQSNQVSTALGNGAARSTIGETSTDRDGGTRPLSQPQSIKDILQELCR